MTDSSILRIFDLESLERLPPFMRGRAALRRVDVDHPDPEVSARFGRLLNRHFFACGCEVGAIFVAAILIVLAFSIALSGGAWSDILTWESLALVGGAALSGKAGGLAYSWNRVRTARHELRRLFAPGSSDVRRGSPAGEAGPP